MNTIDYTNQVMTVNSVSENTTGSNAITASAINSSLLTDGKVDVSKLMLEIQKLLGKMVRILQDYQQQQLSQSYQIQLAVLRARIKPLMKKGRCNSRSGWWGYFISIGDLRLFCSN